MISPHHSPANPADSAAPGEEDSSTQRSPLGRAVSADLEALKNDVEQAKELAWEYQRQLAGKSNEFASLKHLFEKTSEDLAHLRNGIAQLREERHRLANDAMRAAALDLKLARITQERDFFKSELEALKARRCVEIDARVADLTQEVTRLRMEQEANRQELPASLPASLESPKGGLSEQIPISYFDQLPDDHISIVPTEGPSISATQKFRRSR